MYRSVGKKWWVVMICCGWLTGCVNNNIVKLADERECERTIYLQDNANAQNKFCVKVADNDTKRATGLMGVKEMSDDEGMLFLFDNSDFLSFWMKNTLIPLDILYFDEQGVLVDYKNDFQPCQDGLPCVGYVSKKTAKYVLEINSDVYDEDYWQKQVGYLRVLNY